MSVKIVAKVVILCLPQVTISPSHAAYGTPRVGKCKAPQVLQKHTRCFTFSMLGSGHPTGSNLVLR